MKQHAHSAYGAWLAYMMDIKRVDTEKLAKKAGVEPQTIADLVEGSLEPERAREEIARIGEILLSTDPRERMEKVLQALEIHTDLRNWRGSCDGGCCAWNLVTEIAYDEALVIR